MRLGSLQISLPQAIVLAAGLLALGAVLTWAPEDTRAVVIEWLGWGIAALSALLRPLVSRAASAETAEERAARAERARRRINRGPPPGTTMMLLALALVGCGASGLRTQAHAALVAGTVTSAAWAQVDHARTVRLDSVESSVSQSPDRDLIIAREAARWTPIGAGFDAIRDALLAWVQAIELARVAGEDSLTLEDWIRFVPLVGRVVLLYDDVARLARELEIELPALPPAVRALASAPEGR